jgi:prepilin-type processing-associated H-X9-DG protein
MRWRWGCGCLAVSSVLLILMGPVLIWYVFPFVALFELAVGWALFVVRVVPQVRIDAIGLATALVCLVLLVVGVQGFAGWFYGQTALRGESNTPRRWPLRWTLSLVGMVLLLFVAGMAAAGIGHQAGWLIGSKEPLLDSSSRPMINRAMSTNNLKQIGYALTNYAEKYGALPLGGSFDARGRGLHGWQTAILPYVEQRTLYDSIDQSLPWDDPRNAAAFRMRVPVYQHPGIPETSDPHGYALSHYAGNVYVLGCGAPRTPASLTDGSSNTMLAGEVSTNLIPWGDPRNWRDPTLGLHRHPDGFGGLYGGTNILFADGSVKFVKDSVSPEVLRAIATPDGGEGFAEVYERELRGDLER